MYIPSYDFRIFDVPFFSPLQAQEFGASTMFSSNTPLSYIDDSLNAFADLTVPRFLQDTPEAAKERLRRLRDQANEVLGETPAERARFPTRQTQSTTGCPPGYKPVSVFGLFSYCGKGLRSDGEGTMGDDPTKSAQKVGGQIQTLQDAFKALPAGSGIFIIAIVVVILLVLFVRR